MIFLVADLDSFGAWPASSFTVMSPPTTSSFSDFIAGERGVPNCFVGEFRADFLDPAAPLATLLDGEAICSVLRSACLVTKGFRLGHHQARSSYPLRFRRERVISLEIHFSTLRRARVLLMVELQWLDK